MTRDIVRWRSPRLLGREITVVRYGVSGAPLLLFPTAGGDAEEPERFHLIEAAGRFLADQRLKIYCVDSVSGRAWLHECEDLAEAAAAQQRFDACLVEEVVPHVRRDSGDYGGRLLTAGASIGAFNALAALCRHPDVFRTAICMSGTYDMRRFADGEPNADYEQASPLRFVPRLREGEHLAALRGCFVLLAHGKGSYEDPAESWRAADVLGARGIPNRVDEWGEEWRHDWITWRAMLPVYLGEFLPPRGEAVR
ncbi:MAG: alpha/beta hydrolase-fold protein [Planctomycetota bacterium]